MKQTFISWVNGIIQDIDVVSLIWDYCTVTENEAYTFLKDWDYLNRPTEMPLEFHKKLELMDKNYGLFFGTDIVWVCRLDGFHDFVVWLRLVYYDSNGLDTKADYSIDRYIKDSDELEKFIEDLESQGFKKCRVW